MFTGIVEEIGHIVAFDAGRLSVESPVVLTDAELGASIAVNGCCLTVVEFDDRRWSADLSDETIARTSFASAHTGDAVNLERAVQASQRLGGHLVQGHVDGVGEIVAAVPDLRVRIPERLLPYLVEKGSVTVDGVSLTVVDVTDGTFSVAVIPHTAEVTTLGRRVPGDPVNIEVDVMAKYVEQMLQPHIDDLRGGNE